MKVVRPVRMHDLEGLLHCVETAGTGMLNPPKQPELLEALIHESEAALNKQILIPERENYLFVLASPDGKIEGTAGIHSCAGGNHSFYTFKQEHDTLQLQVHREGPTEICALYLLPELRKENYGKLLSLSRFFFMAAHPQRFKEKVLASMRGFTEEQRSPFWEEIGKHFLPVEFSEVMKMRMTNEEFIEKIFSKSHIQISQLPLIAQQVIGKVHSNTQPALNMLLEEGFEITPEIDPIDGGPILSVSKSEIRTIAKSMVSMVAEVSSHLIGMECLISNERLDFRICYGKIKNLGNGYAALSEDVADTLGVRTGDVVRYLQIMET